MLSDILFFMLESLKLALRVEIQQWKLLFGKALNASYKTKLEDILEFIEDYSKRLSRPIRDLEDVRQAMGALSDIRENQIYMDMMLGPIEVYYYFFPIIQSFIDFFGLRYSRHYHWNLKQGKQGVLINLIKRNTKK